MSGKTILFAGLGAAALGGLALATRDSIPGAVEQDWNKKLIDLADRGRRTLKAVSSSAWPGHTVTYQPNTGFFVDRKGPLDSPHQAAMVLWERKKAQANYEDDDDYEEAWRRREEEVRELARQLGLPPVGLNADWSVSAWHAGPSDSANMTGGDVYILEDEEAYDPQQLYMLVRRWYVDDGYETGQKYLGLPKKYQDWADGSNDAIVELGTYPTFAKAAKAAIKLRDQLRRRGQRASRQRDCEGRYCSGYKCAVCARRREATRPRPGAERRKSRESRARQVHTAGVPGQPERYRHQALPLEVERPPRKRKGGDILGRVQKRLGQKATRGPSWGAAGSTEWKLRQAPKTEDEARRQFLAEHKEWIKTVVDWAKMDATPEERTRINLGLCYKAAWKEYKAAGFPKGHAEVLETIRDAVLKCAYERAQMGVRPGWYIRDAKGWGRRSTVVPLHSVKNLKRVCRVLEEQFGWPANDWAFAGAGPSGTEAASLTLVRANQRGHYPLPTSLRKLLRLPAFRTYDEAMDAADRLNQLRGMSGARAGAIIASSMFGSLANRRRRR